jgi:hypothetical protein
VVDVVEQPLACGAEGKGSGLGVRGAAVTNDAIARIAFIESR